MVAACSDGLSDAQKSGAFGFPIPDGVNVTETEATDVGEYYSYKVYADYDDLLEWYSGRLIKGQDRGDWQWCAYTDSEISGGRWRIYSYVHPNGSGVEISLLKNSRQAGGEVGIVISEKKNGASFFNCDA